MKLKVFAGPDVEYIEKQFNEWTQKLNPVIEKINNVINTPDSNRERSCHFIYVYYDKDNKFK
jgi:hypothetical protein